MPHSAERTITVLSLAGVGLTLPLFVAALCAKRRHHNHGLNYMAGVLVVSPICFIVPLMYVRDRTPQECALLHHWAASSMVLDKWLVLTFYLLRSNQISSGPSQRRLGRVLITVQGVLFVCNLVGINTSIRTAVRPDDHNCVVFIQQSPVGLVFCGLPLLFEVVVNARFVWLVMGSILATRRTTDTSGLSRIVRVTCAIAVVTVGVHLLLIPLLFSVENTFHSCSVAWPSIFIAALKCVRRRTDPIQASLAARFAEVRQPPPPPPPPPSDGTFGRRRSSLGWLRYGSVKSEFVF